MKHVQLLGKILVEDYMCAFYHCLEASRLVKLEINVSGMYYKTSLLKQMFKAHCCLFNIFN